MVARGCAAIYNGTVIPSTAAACRNHPEREAIGICVECRTRICSECVTKVDGINYCVGCLSTLAAADDAHERAQETATSPVLAAFSAFGYFLVLTLMAWVLVEVAMPGSG